VAPFAQVDRQASHGSRPVAVCAPGLVPVVDTAAEGFALALAAFLFGAAAAGGGRGAGGAAGWWGRGQGAGHQGAEAGEDGLAVADLRPMLRRGQDQLALSGQAAAEPLADPCLLLRRQHPRPLDVEAQLNPGGGGVGVLAARARAPRERELDLVFDHRMTQLQAKNSSSPYWSWLYCQTSANLPSWTTDSRT
jgi:hypothetical protein